MYAALAVANLSTSAATHPQLLEEEVLRHGSLVLSKKRLEVDLKNFFLDDSLLMMIHNISWPWKGTSRMSSIVQYSAGGKVLRFQRLPWLPCLANSSCWGCDGLSWDVWELNAFDIAAVCTTISPRCPTTRCRAGGIIGITWIGQSDILWAVGPHHPHLNDVAVNQPFFPTSSAEPCAQYRLSGHRHAVPFEGSF